MYTLNLFTGIFNNFVILSEESHGYCGGIIALIFAILSLFAVILYGLLVFSKISLFKDSVLCSNKHLLNTIFVLCVSVIFTFSLVTLGLHECALSLTAFIMSLVALTVYVVLFILSLLKVKDECVCTNNEEVEKEEIKEEPKETTNETVVLDDKSSNEEISSEPKEETIDKKIESVTVSEANEIISDEVAIEVIENNKIVHIGKKGIINVDTLSKVFNDGDTVDIKALKEKKLIPDKIEQVKLLARGSLDKVLNVELQDYSIEAVKMVLALGGTIKRC